MKIGILQELDYKLKRIFTFRLEYRDQNCFSTLFSAIT